MLVLGLSVQSHMPSKPLLNSTTSTRIYLSKIAVYSGKSMGKRRAGTGTSTTSVFLGATYTNITYTCPRVTLV